MASLPIKRVVATLLALGFQPVLSDDLYLTFLRRDSALGVCTIVIDSSEDDIWEEQLVKYLDLHGISLADFWNLYDTIGDS